MTIIVVQTCDGPVYFRNSMRNKVVASDLAVEQITRHGVGELSPEDRMAISGCLANRDYKSLYKALVLAGALTEAQVQD